MNTTTSKVKQSPITQPFRIKNNFNKTIYSIGIPKENTYSEKRVILTPYDLKPIIDLGHKVYIEQGAGQDNYPDLAYSNIGAKIIEQKQQIFEKCDIIAKVSPITTEEAEMLGTDKIIFSSLQLSDQKANIFKLLKEKRTTAISYDMYADDNGFNPFIHILGEIIGSSSVIIAAELMSNSNGGNGLMLGGLTGLAPTEIMILGSDISAMYTVKIALGLGANVKVFDSSIQRLIKFHDYFGQHLYTSNITSPNLFKSLKTADVIINTLAFTDEHDYVITDEMLCFMQKGAVIIDLRIDTGSVIESSKITTFENPTFVKNNITHYCVPNIASRVAKTSSIAISGILSQILLQMLSFGDIIPFLQNDNSFKNGTYMLKGIPTNKIIAEKYSLDYTDINLLIHIL